MNKRLLVLICLYIAGCNAMGGGAEAGRSSCRRRSAYCQAEMEALAGAQEGRTSQPSGGLGGSAHLPAVSPRRRLERTPSMPIAQMQEMLKELLSQEKIADALEQLAEQQMQQIRLLARIDRTQKMQLLYEILKEQGGAGGDFMIAGSPCPGLGADARDKLVRSLCDYVRVVVIKEEIFDADSVDSSDSGASDRIW